MSSLPGLDLEDYLAWQYDLIVEGDGSANPSLEIAEALGVATRRQRVSAEQFQRLVIASEHLRHDVEYRLGQFDEETQSWRDYAGYAFDGLDEPTREQSFRVMGVTAGLLGEVGR